MSIGDRFNRIRRAEAENINRRRQRRARPRSPGRWRRWLLRLTAAGALLAVVGAVGALWLYWRNVVVEPGEHLGRTSIQSIIAQETPILYRDGQTRMGVFFAREHREYVPYDRIPDAWKHAIVAAEDQRFFQHLGVDPWGIARAMKQNVAARRLVAGGSSLTQQTAKNLYYRPDRSLRSKWDELVNALRLEAHYSKDDILEFYANQFHVSANGRGIGIAARYFFNKRVEELDTLECAFIAGMVKAPAAYNPFIGATAERRDKARAKAKARTRYVLDRMLTVGKLTETEHARLVEQDIPFVRGEFRYASSVVVDAVAERLSQAPFPELFADMGIDNPSTAGIEIVTTIDEVAQRGATYGLWHHLSVVGGMLEGVSAASLAQPPESAPQVDPDNPPVAGEFSMGTLVAKRDEESLQLDVDLGGVSCVVDQAGIKRMAEVIVKGEKGEPWRKARASDVRALWAGLEVGTVLWVSVRSSGLCDLEFRPVLQGAVIALDDGQIRAMVGGNDNRDFNRAVDAHRQLGSTWKPIIFHSAMQLGWAPSDALDNREGVFSFEGTWYYPRADHRPAPLVSMGWAGTRSENLASIWLLAHLLDRVDSPTFLEISKLVGLAPRDDERRGDWIRRIRDDWGIISTPERYPELAYSAAKREVAQRDGVRESEAVELRSLFYGRGVQAERSRVRAGKKGTTQTRKLKALQRNFLEVSAAWEQCQPQVEAVHDFIVRAQKANARPSLLGGLFGAELARPIASEVGPTDAVRLRFVGAGVDFACGTPDEEGWRAVDVSLLESLAASPPVEPLADSVDPLVIGSLRATLVDEVRRVAERRRLLLEAGDAYDLEALQHHPDFRVLVAMRYVALQARTLGVEADLPPVLSLPLGAVDLSLEQMATVYQTMLSGTRWLPEGERAGLLGTEPVAAAEAPTLLIAEIRDRSGNSLYRATPEPKRVAPAQAGEMLGSILGNVVSWGTGRRARGRIQLGTTPVPVGGKTGTTNGFRNAAFVGVVPSASKTGWGVNDGVVLASYVGYDDNRPMRKGGIRLAGASGALNPWIGTAQAVVDAGLIGDVVPEGEVVLPDGFASVSVSSDDGMAAFTQESGQPQILVWGRGTTEDGEVSVRRIVSPSGDPVLTDDVGSSRTGLTPETQTMAEEVLEGEELEEVWLEAEWGEAPSGVEASPEIEVDAARLVPVGDGAPSEVTPSEVTPSAEVDAPRIVPD